MIKQIDNDKQSKILHIYHIKAQNEYEKTDKQVKNQKP